MKTVRSTIALFLLAAAALACHYPTATPQGESAPTLPSPTLTPAAAATAPATETATATATAAATARPAPEIMSLVDAKDGDTLVASIDPASGFPILSIQVQARRAGNPQITLEADGLQAAISSLADYPPVQTVTLTWIPWHGNGTYHLDARLVKGAGDIMAQQSIAVEVSGIPDGTPTIQERFIQLYQEQFDLNLTAPAFAHNITHIESGVDEYNRWVSAAYIQDKIYTIYLFDNGEVTYLENTVSDTEPMGICHPAGKYEILVIIVNYGNTGVGSEGVRAELDEAAEAANLHWAQYAASIGLPEPILQIETTTAFVDSPPVPGEFLTLEQVESLTGYDPTQFSLLAEVDMDAESRAMHRYSGGKSGGLAFLNRCRPGGNPVDTNLSFVINSQRSLDLVGFSLYEHELMHLMGWMHWWPNGDGSSLAQFSAGRYLPYLLYGWTDTDGDGTIELYDPTPYGLQP